MPRTSLQAPPRKRQHEEASSSRVLPPPPPVPKAPHPDVFSHVLQKSWTRAGAVVPAPAPATAAGAASAGQVGKGQRAVPATMTLFWKICIATAQAGGRAATSGRTKTSSGARQNLSVQHMRTMLSNESFSTEAGPRACPRSQPRAGPAEHGHRVGPQHE